MLAKALSANEFTTVIALIRAEFFSFLRQTTLPTNPYGLPNSRLFTVVKLYQEFFNFKANYKSAALQEIEAITRLTQKMIASINNLTEATLDQILEDLQQNFATEKTAATLDYQQNRTFGSFFMGTRSPLVIHLETLENIMPRTVAVRALAHADS